MNEPFIIDHDNPKKIIVSDYNDFASCYEHYPLYFKGNRIYVLGVESERTYLKNRVNLRMEVYEYSFWKPIPEPKFRPMTWEEALPILCSAWIESDNFNYKSKVKIININKQRFKLNTNAIFSYRDLSDLYYRFHSDYVGKKFEVEVKE